MTPKRCIMKVPYWTCLIEQHRHTTKQIAERCIERFNRRGTTPNAKWTNETREQVLLLHESGMTYKAVGERLGLSGARAAQICKRALRRREWLGSYALTANQIATKTKEALSRALARNK